MSQKCAKPSKTIFPQAHLSRSWDFKVMGTVTGRMSSRRACIHGNDPKACEERQCVVKDVLES